VRSRRGPRYRAAASAKTNMEPAEVGGLFISRPEGDRKPDAARLCRNHVLMVQYFEHLREGVLRVARSGLDMSRRTAAGLPSTLIGPSYSAAWIKTCIAFCHRVASCLCFDRRLIDSPASCKPAHRRRHVGFGVHRRHAVR
jgi:hypothetical protein